MTPVARLAQACVQRPVATILLAVALVLAGLLALRLLPVAPLPQAVPGLKPTCPNESITTPSLRKVMASLPFQDALPDT